MTSMSITLFLALFALFWQGIKPVRTAEQESFKLPESQDQQALQKGSEYLNITAVLSESAYPHHAYLQCWQLTSNPFQTYPTVGQSVVLPPISNTSTYVILPPGSAEGWHNPPHPMLFVLLSGVAHVVTPHSGQEMWLEVGGVNQIVLALDVLGKGHLTYYPDDTFTTALQIPLSGDVELKHTVLHQGACRDSSG